MKTIEEYKKEYEEARKNYINELTKNEELGILKQSAESYTVENLLESIERIFKTIDQYKNDPVYLEYAFERLDILLSVIKDRALFQYNSFISSDDTFTR